MKKIFEKPNIVISKCINFDNCRFNGDKVNDDFLQRLSEYVNYIPVCPEVAIGLGTPRLPVRIVKDKDKNQRLYQPGTKKDLTDKINTFSQAFLKSQKNIDGFIMKNRSPSCGLGDIKVYDSMDSNMSGQKNGVGFFTQNVNNTFPSTPKEDEGRLKNFRLREDFLTKIFCLADFRSVRKKSDIKELQDFQAKNKYLFMLYNQGLQLKLGQTVASYKKDNLEEIYKDYYNMLLELFDTATKDGKMINSLTHIFGYFKNNCSSEEKQFFLESLETYREGRIPTSSLIYILKTWALRDNTEYILKQTILNPYPQELISLSHSGKLLKL